MGRLAGRSQRGRWKLSEEGWGLDLKGQTAGSAYELFKKVRHEHSGIWGQSLPDDSTDPEQPSGPISESDAEDVALASDLRSTVSRLTPTGFEHLCKRLLTELGLEQLRTVGRAGDRGIDVEGNLRINSVVSFRVGLQCKLYAESNQVTPRQIREFQGALGPFDRGIFVTTSVFTKQAEERATSAGYKPIDLIDGERLIELLISHSLGVKTATIVDHSFFAPFG